MGKYIEEVITRKIGLRVFERIEDAIWKFDPRDILTHKLVKVLPKVDLHYHLDGSMRAETIVELAKKQQVELPHYSHVDLREHLQQGAKRGSLKLYLEGFAYTTGVLQTREALYRSAYECLEDNAKDGVVYVEIRFAPVLHVQGGLSLDQVVEAVLDGLKDAEANFNINWGVIICAMRDRSDSLEMAKLAVKYRHQGVVGFDLAGEEAGYPAKDHIEAFDYCKQSNFNITIHAGEAFGVHSIWQALQHCGAHRIGHGTRLIDDMKVVDGQVKEIGDIAGYVLDHRIPLEVCISSNIQTKAAESYEKHPFRHFWNKNYRVFLNTDNTLMSATNLTEEYVKAINYYHLSLRDLEKLTINAMKSAFIPYNQRNYIIYNVIKPGYLMIRERLVGKK
ncbi:MAG: adenosine deaminase [bacterium]